MDSAKWIVKFYPYAKIVKYSKKDKDYFISVLRYDFTYINFWLPERSIKRRLRPIEIDALTDLTKFKKFVKYNIIN